MIESEKTQLFEKTPIPKAVAVLAVPTICSSLVMVLYNMADTYFVGMLNDPIQNAAVTIAAPVLLAFNAVNNLFGVGSSSMMSRALGKKDYDTMERSSAFGFYSALICGILLSLLYFTFQEPALRILGADAENAAASASYLKWTTTFGATPAILNVVMAYLVRSEGAALHASIGTISGCLLNIILDPIFILPQGFGMGAEGAGLATFLSNCTACLYFFVLLWVRRGKTHVCIHPGKFLPGKAIVLGVCGVGIPAAIQNLLNVTGMTVLNNFASEYGSNAMAAIGIAQKLNMIPLYVALGLGQGIMPLFSYNYASENTKRLKQTITFAMKLSIGFLAVLTVIYYFSANVLIGMFMENQTVVEHGVRFLRGMCLALPFMGVDFLAVGVFQACGFGKNALVFAILRKVVLEIPALYILNCVFPLYGLAYAQPVAEVVLAIAAAVILMRMFKKMDQKSAR